MADYLLFFNHDASFHLLMNVIFKHQRHLDGSCSTNAHRDTSLKKNT